MRTRAHDGADVHAGGGEARAEVVGENVIADAADHADGNPARQTARGARLIGAFAAGDHLKAAAENGFARRREVFGGDDEVHVQTSDHHQGGAHRPSSIPSFFSSSA
jgi:hypothetical protein